MYNIIICDKNLSFTKEFHYLLKQMTYDFSLECCITKCKEERQVAEILNTRSIDLLFLSIESEKQEGFEFGNHLCENLCNFDLQIVYVSENPKCAIELMNTIPLGFLQKPVSKENLQSIMERFLKKKNIRTDIFRFKNGKKLTTLPYDEILYFQSTLRKIVIITENETKEFYEKLDNIEKQLPEYFIRIHKSYIVNAHYVTNYRYNNVTLLDKQLLTISRSYKKHAHFYLKKYVDIKF